MESESSAIARKLQNYLLIENAEPRDLRKLPNVQTKEEPGIFKNLLLISLMGAAVLLTQMSLVLVKWTKRIEG
jgi:hypothetical protein